MTDLDFDPQRCGQRILAHIAGASRLTVVAPFVTRAGIMPILDAVPADCDFKLITRWRPDEVATGASDPRVLDLIEQRGGTLWLHPVVHAKAYVTPTRAVVGSANATVNGLGWSGPGAVEIVVDVAADDPAVAALLAVLERTSVQATEADRDSALAAAAAMARSPIRTEIPATDRADWLPTYRLPDVLWRVYTGQREESIAELVRPELEALGVPPGLPDEQTFNLYVGSILRQGFTGRIARECSNLLTIRAVERLQALCEQAERSLPDPAGQWETLAAWIAHFLPAYQRITGGTRLIG